MQIVVSGSTGFLGTITIAALRDAGHQVRRLVRARSGSAADEIPWQPGEGKLDPARLNGVDAVIHLSGENVGQRWTRAVKSRIWESRVRTTEVLAHAIAQAQPRPRVLLAASGVGYYGDRGDEILHESSGPGSDFFAKLGQEWEGATLAAARAGVRVVSMRMAPILSSRGGMLSRLLPIFRIGAGGKIASGNQWLSWIARADFVRVVQFLLEREDMRGPVNVVAPNPVTNAEFTRRLGSALGRPTLATVPAFALRLVYGEMADATLLVSQRAVSRRLLDAGFEFRYPFIQDALQQAVSEG